MDIYRKYDIQTPMEDILVQVESSIPHPDSWGCPRCGGTGSNPEGSVMGEIIFNSAIPCWLCRGKGQVTCVPIED